MLKKLCNAHPKYKAKRKPRSLCEVCWFAYFKLNVMAPTKSNREVTDASNGPQAA